MSSRAICYDNAIKETFLKTLLAELTYHVNFKDRNDARKEIFSYKIELFYNRLPKSRKCRPDSISVRHPVLLCYCASAEPLPSETPLPDT